MSTNLGIFSHEPGTRVAVPMWIGLTGAPSSGKTFSALRLAVGIQQVVGGDIFVMDTENRRARHYGDHFRFQHVDFRAPFASRRYLDGIRYCVDQGARVVVVDSMSHEHEGEGGYLTLHEQELRRISGNDPAKMAKAQFRAWIKPASQRRAMINALLQTNVNLIFCFRAKEKLKPDKKGDASRMIEMGYMPIAGMELFYEQTISALLTPNSNGVPQWTSQLRGEADCIKLPLQFKPYFMERNGRSLNEEAGEMLARWSAGHEQTPVVAKTVDPIEPPSAEIPSTVTPARFKELDHQLHDAAMQGMAKLRECFQLLSDLEQQTMRTALEMRHKPTARQALSYDAPASERATGVENDQPDDPDHDGVRHETHH